MAEEELELRIKELEEKSDELANEKAVLEEKVKTFEDDGLSAEDLLSSKVKEKDELIETERTENRRLKKEIAVGKVKTEFPDVDFDLVSVGAENEADLRTRASKIQESINKAVVKATGKPIQPAQPSNVQPPSTVPVPSSGSGWEQAGSISPATDAEAAAQKQAESDKRRKAKESGDVHGVIDSILKTGGKTVNRIFRVGTKQGG